MLRHRRIGPLHHWGLDGLRLLLVLRVVAMSGRKLWRRDRHRNHGRRDILALIGWISYRMLLLLLLVMSRRRGRSMLLVGLLLRWLLRLGLMLLRLLRRWRGATIILHLDIFDISRGNLETLGASCGLIPCLEDDAPAWDDALDLSGDGVRRYLHADEHYLARERVAVGSHGLII